MVGCIAPITLTNSPQMYNVMWTNGFLQVLQLVFNRVRSQLMKMELHTYVQ